MAKTRKVEIGFSTFEVKKITKRYNFIEDYNKFK